MKYDFEAIEAKWQKYWIENKTYRTPDESDKPKFYGLIEFPALASANLRQMMLLKGAADKLKENAISFTNDIAEKLKQTIDNDIELVRRYNEDMAGGKWRHMMSSKHVNFINWNDEGSEYPEIPSTEPKEQGNVYISVNRDTPMKAGVYM